MEAGYRTQSTFLGADRQNPTLGLSQTCRSIEPRGPLPVQGLPTRGSGSATGLTGFSFAFGGQMSKIPLRLGMGLPTQPGVHQPTEMTTPTYLGRRIE